MAISIPQGYMVTAPEPIDHRLVLTKRQMRLISRDEGQLPEKYFCLCSDKEEDGSYRFYVFDKRNPWTEETGKYVQVGEASEGLDYENLSNKPMINDVPLIGNLSPEDLGLQGALTVSEGFKLDDDKLQLLIDLNTLGINANHELFAKADTSGLDNEILRAKTSEGILFELIDAETERATAADSVLKNLIDSEAARVDAAKVSIADLRQSLDQEILDREDRTALLSARLTSEATLRDAKDQELENATIRGIRVDAVQYTPSADHIVDFPLATPTTYGAVKYDNETIILNNNKLKANIDDYTIKYDNKVKVNFNNVQKKTIFDQGLRATSEGTYTERVNVLYDALLNDSEATISLRNNHLYAQDVLYAGPGSAKGTLKDIIPAAAGSTTTQDPSGRNKLVDYDTFIDALTASLGVFRGTFDSEGALESAFPKGLADKNDYAFVTHVSSEGTFYDRYKCIDKAGDNWEYEFRVATSAFTADQWKALQSLATKEDIKDLKAHILRIDNPHNVTATQLHLGAFENKSIDSEAVAGSTNPISSGAVKAALDEKQGTLTFTDYLVESEGTVRWELYDRVRKGTGNCSLVIGDPTKGSANGENSIAFAGKYSSRAASNNSIALQYGEIQVPSGKTAGDFNLAAHGGIIRSGNDSNITVIGYQTRAGYRNGTRSSTGAKVISHSAFAFGNRSSVFGGNQNTAQGNNSSVLASTDSSAAGTHSAVINSDDSIAKASNSTILNGEKSLIDTSGSNSILIGTRAVSNGSGAVTISSTPSSASISINSIRFKGDQNVTTYDLDLPGNNTFFTNVWGGLYNMTQADLLEYILSLGYSVYVYPLNSQLKYTINTDIDSSFGTNDFTKVSSFNKTNKTITLARTISPSRAITDDSMEIIATCSTGVASIAIGCMVNAARTNSIAIGHVTSSKAEKAIAIGNGILTDTDNTMALGKWNVKPTSIQSFVIGNGTGPDNKRNALTIDTDNHVAIVTDPANDMDVVPYKMLHKIIRNDGNGASVTLAKAERERTYIYKNPVTSLTINEFDSEGVSDVIFTSGASITVSLPTGVKKPADFTFEPNKTYEINVLDNLALIGTWE